MENKTIYYNEAVDFLRMENCPEKVEIAISRLEYPLGLDEERVPWKHSFTLRSISESVIKLGTLRPDRQHS